MQWQSRLHSHWEVQILLAVNIRSLKALWSDDFQIFVSLLQALHDAAFRNLMSKVLQVVAFFKICTIAGFEGSSFVIVEGREFVLPAFILKPAFSTDFLPLAVVSENGRFRQTEEQYRLQI